MNEVVKSTGIHAVGKKKNRSNDVFGEKLRVLRKKRKVTMKKLADQLGVSESYISRLESGERHPDKELILKLSSVLFPEGDPVELDSLLIAADFTPINLDKFTGDDGVIHHFQEILDQDPENFRVFNALVISLIKQGNLIAARNQIQEGLKRFDDSIHLQVLMGTLEMAHGRYDMALVYHQEALKAFEQSSGEEFDSVNKVNMLLNLAVIYFMKGYELIDAYLQQGSQDFYLNAHSNLTLASDSLKEALKLEPEDIYVLDEFARVAFNLAYLDDSAQKTPDYTLSIQAFERVIHSEEKALLNYSELIESSLFLVHAYAKNQNFAAAEQHINIIECCLPNYWLVHYIKACLYSLKFAVFQDSKHLDLGLNALERALAIQDKGNRALAEAPYDPDLALLQKSAPERFKKMLKLEANA